MTDLLRAYFTFWGQFPTPIYALSVLFWPGLILGAPFILARWKR